jgi:hypothetical protein
MQEQQLNYAEASLTTTDTKFAATLLVFGFKLKSHNPLTWKNEFSSKAQYLAWVKNQSKDNAPIERADWNFEDNRYAQWLYKGFTSESADQTLKDVLDRLLADQPKERQGVEHLVNACVAQACRQVLERREFLIRLLKTVPYEAQWIVVRGPGRLVAMFGINASIETQTEHLSRV